MRGLYREYAFAQAHQNPHSKLMLRDPKSPDGANCVIEVWCIIHHCSTKFWETELIDSIDQIVPQHCATLLSCLFFASIPNKCFNLCQIMVFELINWSQYSCIWGQHHKQPTAISGNWTTIMKYITELWYNKKPIGQLQGFWIQMNFHISAAA